MSEKDKTIISSCCNSEPIGEVVKEYNTIYYHGFCSK